MVKETELYQARDVVKERIPVETVVIIYIWFRRRTLNTAILLNLLDGRYLLLLICAAELEAMHVVCIDMPEGHALDCLVHYFHGPVGRLAGQVGFQEFEM